MKRTHNVRQYLLSLTMGVLLVIEFFYSKVCLAR